MSAPTAQPLHLPALNQVTFAGYLAAVRSSKDGRGVTATFVVTVPRRDVRDAVRVPCTAAGAMATTLLARGDDNVPVLITGALVSSGAHLHVRVTALQFLA